MTRRAPSLRWRRARAGGRRYRHTEGPTVIKGFRDFVLRGNVIDLAVAVVIGAAFTGVVNAIAENLINPVVAALGGRNVEGITWQLVEGNEASTIDWGALVTALLNFLIVAAVVYFVFVTPMNRLRVLRAKGEQPPPVAAPEDVLLLREIRDLLRGAEAGAADGRHAAGSAEGA